MSTKQKVLTLADQLGVTVEVGRREITMEAPDGFVFSATFTHGVVASIWDDQTMAHMWRYSLSDIKHGIEPCFTDDCDVCEGY